MEVVNTVKRLSQGVGPLVTGWLGGKGKSFRLLTRESQGRVRGLGRGMSLFFFSFFG